MEKGTFLGQKIGNYQCFPTKPGSTDPGLFFFVFFTYPLPKWTRVLQEIDRVSEPGSHDPGLSFFYSKYLSCSKVDLSERTLNDYA